jgi:hypothetical protein
MMGQVEISKPSQFRATPSACNQILSFANGGKLGMGFEHPMQQGGSGPRIAQQGYW